MGNKNDVYVIKEIKLLHPILIAPYVKIHPKIGSIQALKIAIENAIDLLF